MFYQHIPKALFQFYDIGNIGPYPQSALIKLSSRMMTRELSILIMCSKDLQCFYLLLVRIGHIAHSNPVNTNTLEL